MVDQRFLSRLAFCASFFALGVIALGAYTRLMDAGLGCPDWPGCYGHMIAPLTNFAEKSVTRAWTEMIHRYFVGGLSVLITTMIVMIFTQKKIRTGFNISIALFLIALLGYQIMLGQWTVTLKLLPVIVSQHLLGGYLILSSLWLIYLNNTTTISLKRNMNAVKLMPWGIFALLLLLMQIILGAWTSTNYASLSCSGFPFCVDDQVMVWHWREAFNIFAPIGVNYDGGVLPDVVRQTIQMAHRLGALIVTTYLVLFIALASLQLKNRPNLSKLLYIVSGLLCVQICLGISNVIFKLPLHVALAHTLAAALLFVSLLTFVFRLIFDRRGALQ